MASFPYVIGFWNARSASGKMEEIDVLTEWVHVLGIAEPGALQGLKDFYCYGNDRGPGVVVLVHYSVPHQWWHLTACPGVTAVAVQLWWDGSWVTLVIAYAYGSFTECEWNSWLSSLPRPIIVCGDLNAHHTIWGGKRQNRRGAVIADSLLGQDLVVLNDGTPTFSRWHGGLWQESVLDLVLCSSRLVGAVKMVVSDDLRGSDHFPLLVEGSTGTLQVSGVDHTGHGFRSVVLQGSFGNFLRKWKLGPAGRRNHCKVRGLKKPQIW